MSEPSYGAQKGDYRRPTSVDRGTIGKTSGNKEAENVNKDV